MLNLTKKLICTCALLMSSITFANADSHTTRKIVVNDQTQKNWQVEFTALSEQSLVQFTDVNGNSIPVNIFYPVTDVYTYGFSFATGGDFDIVYAITAISYDHQAFTSGNAKCVFLLTAQGAAVPENYVSNFQNANCKLQRDENDVLNLVLDKSTMAK